MNDHQHPPPTTQISIQEIIQIRVMLGNEEQVESEKLTETLDSLDTIILNFAKSLKGN